MCKRSIFFIILIIFLIYLFFSNLEINETFKNYRGKFLERYKKYWSPYDYRARRRYNCNPIYIKKGLNNNKIWYVPRECEQGLPHTRENNIISLPINYMNIDSHRKSKTLTHEYVHLDQKQNYGLWKKFYEREWFYTLSDVPPPNMPRNLILRYRLNPDTFIEKWACFNKKWWSVPIYTNNYSLNNAKILWFYDNNNDNNIYENPPQEWIDFFGPVESIGQIEHPNEISAVYLTNPDKYDSKAFKILYKWRTINQLD